MRPLSRTVAAGALALPLLAGVLAGSSTAATDSTGRAETSTTSDGPSLTTAAARRAERAAPRWTGFESARAWGRGRLDGVRVDGDVLRFGEPAGTRRYAGRRYAATSWTSPWVEPGLAFTRLVASWNAQTPGDSWIEVAVRGRTGARTTDWDVLGRWTSGDRSTKRRNAGTQSDGGTSVNIDTWQTAPLRGYQLRVALLRRGKAEPTVRMLGAVAATSSARGGPTSRPGPARGTVLDVPAYSQMAHRGHFPQWGSGGEAWCSPTSVSMVLGYYDALPSPKRYRWVPRGHVDPWVDYAARMTYDHAYEGTGNWPFNTAYAGSRVGPRGSAFVTRLGSMRQAERFIAAGIPLVISIAFDPGELSGAPISSSNGHLLVVSGFRRNGDVVVNDPAASSRDGVRRVYDRAQLERIWLSASAGTTYVIHDRAHPLPQGRSNAW